MASQLHIATRTCGRIMRFCVVFALLFGWFSGNAFCDKIAGVSVVSPSQKVDGSWVASVKKLNAGWVAVMPYAMGQAGSPKLRFDGEFQWWGEKFEGIQTIIHDAKQQGLKVMLKPMVWVHGSWVGAFDLKTEAEWKLWESSYTSYLDRLTEIAIAEGVDMICIGTELKIAVQKRAKYFAQLTDAIRLKYKGKVTYAANWDDFLTIKFWDKLDYIGIDAYFPLVEAKLPAVADLKLAWVTHARKILSLYLAHKKPILFTEFGYRSIDLCCWQQWERENLPHDQEVNLQGQVNAYQAFFESFWDQPWFAGVFLWQWYTHHERAGGLKNSDFTPQNKPAEKVISSWFGKG